MKKNKRPSSQVVSSNLSASAVLGFKDRGSAEWNRLRGLQYSALKDQTNARWISHLLMAVIVAGIYVGKAPLWWIVGWLIALALTNLRGTLFDRSLANAADRYENHFFYNCFSDDTF